MTGVFVLKSHLLFPPVTPWRLLSTITSYYWSLQPHALKRHVTVAVLFLQEFSFCL